MGKSVSSRWFSTVAAVGVAALCAGCPPNLGGTTTLVDSGGVSPEAFPQGDTLPWSSGDTLPWTTSDTLPGSPVDMRVSSVDHRVSTVDMGVRADTTPTTCDPLKQNCPTGDKCTTELPSGATSFSDVCIATGTVTTGGACTVSGMTFGNDNCVAGDVCWITHVCAKYCAADSSCASGQKCGADLSATLGLCLPTCSLSSSASCTSGNSCNVDNDIDMSLILNCQPVGTTATGGTCTINSDCVANDACLYASSTATSGNCFQLCTVGGTPGCPSTQTCNALPPSTTVGYCQ